MQVLPDRMRSVVPGQKKAGPVARIVGFAHRGCNGATSREDRAHAVTCVELTCGSRFEQQPTTFFWHDERTLRGVPERRERLDMRTSLFVGLLIVGIAAGFGAVAGLLSGVGSGNRPLDLTAALQADKGWSAKLGDGWGYISRRGTVLDRPVATLELPLPSNTADEAVLDVVARPFRAGSGQSLSIQVNGVDGDKWKIDKPTTRRQVLPTAAIRGKNKLQIVFKSSPCSKI